MAGTSGRGNMPVGSKDEPEHRIMRLSEAFEGKSHSLELLADSYNINLAKGKSFWILVMNCGVIVSLSQRYRNI